MKTALVLLAGMLLGAAALGAVWATQATESVDVRVFAERQDDGRVEVGVQQRNNDGDWSDPIRPDARFLPADATVGEARFSEPVALELISRQDEAGAAYAAYLTESGRESGTLINGWRRPDSEAGTLVCVVDHQDATLSALCDGIAETYDGDTVSVVADSFAELRGIVDESLADESTTAIFSTSIATSQLVVESLRDVERRVIFLYWIEMLDQRPTDADALVCQVSHGGRVVEEDTSAFEGDVFWGLSSEVTAAASGQLGVDVAFSTHPTPEAQSDAIRECIKRGASVIATTLAEPDALAAAIAEARAADIPVVSFNSGAEAAAEVGSALHLALDDFKAGALAGEEFMANGVDGTILCVIHEPNNVGLHDRCDGLEAVYPDQVERWVASDPNDIEVVIEELIARMAAGNLAAALGLSVSSGWEIAVAQYYAETELPMGLFGFSFGIAYGVAEGWFQFTIPDQPEIQSYLTASAAVMVDRWRLDPSIYFEGVSLLIAPQVIDQADMQELLNTLTVD